MPSTIIFNGKSYEVVGTGKFSETIFYTLKKLTFIKRIPKKRLNDLVRRTLNIRELGVVKFLPQHCAKFCATFKIRLQLVHSRGTTVFGKNHSNCVTWLTTDDKNVRLATENFALQIHPAPHLLKCNINVTRPIIIIYMIHDYECYQTPKFPSPHPFTDLEYELGTRHVPCMCSLMFTVDTIMFKNYVSDATIEITLSDLLVNLYKLAFDNGFRSHNVLFPLSAKEELEMVTIHIKKRDKFSVNSAKALTDLTIKIVDYLKFKNFDFHFPYDIGLRSTTFNGKNYDEMLSNHQRFQTKLFDRMQIIIKGTRLLSCRCRFNFTRIKFTVVDIASWFVPSPLKKLLLNYKCEIPKGNAPLIALNRWYNNTYVVTGNLPEKHDFHDVNDDEMAAIAATFLGRPYDLVENVATYCCLDTIGVLQLMRVTKKMNDEVIGERMGMNVDCFNQSGAPTMAWKLWLEQRLCWEGYTAAVPDPYFETVENAYFGGRVEYTTLGPLKTGENTPYSYALLDVTSLYPSAMTGPTFSGEYSPMSDEDVRLMNGYLASRRNSQINFVDLIPAFCLIWAKPNWTNLTRPMYGLVPRKCHVHRSLVESDRPVSLWNKKLLWDHCARKQISDTISMTILHNYGWTVKILPYDRNIRFRRWGLDVRSRMRQAKCDKENAADGSAQRDCAKTQLNSTYGNMARRDDGKHMTKIVSKKQIEELTTLESEGKIKILGVTVIESDELKNRRLLNPKPLDSTIEWREKHETAIVTYQPTVREHTEMLHLGANCTANSNYIMVTEMLPLADPFRGFMDLYYRPLTYLYSDTDSVYTDETLTKKIDPKLVSSKIALYDVDRRQFVVNVKIEKTNIRKFVTLGNKFMYASDGTIDKGALIKAKGHPQKAGSQIICEQIFDQMFATDRPPTDLFTERFSMKKAQCGPSSSSLGAFTIRNSSIKRRVQIPPVYGERHPYHTNRIFPYSDTLKNRRRIRTILPSHYYYSSANCCGIGIVHWECTNSLSCLRKSTTCSTVSSSNEEERKTKSTTTKKKMAKSIPPPVRMVPPTKTALLRLKRILKKEKKKSDRKREGALFA